MPNASTQPVANMIWLPGGFFEMGTSTSDLDHLMERYETRRQGLFTAEIPKHTVALAPFYIDSTPVINREFQTFLDEQPEWHRGKIPTHLHNGDYLRHWEDDHFPLALSEHPVVDVCWYAAMAYAQWAGKRLPTEAEWEYAARGGLSGTDFPWGNAIPEPSRANYAASEIGSTTPVGHYPANNYGLFDLAGNVWEFCLDAWQEEFYAVSPEQNPLAGGNWFTDDSYLQVTTRRVIRGGSWGGAPVNLRVAYRDSHPPTGAGNHVGFRCVRST